MCQPPSNEGDNPPPSLPSRSGEDGSLLSGLEELMDQYGMYAVASALAEVCNDKAEHLASAWGDYEAAKNWVRASHACDRLHNALMRIQGI